MAHQQQRETGRAEHDSCFRWDVNLADAQPGGLKAGIAGYSRRRILLAYANFL